MLFPTVESSSLSIVVAQSNERHANRTASVLEWYDRHRVYSTTSGSNEEEAFLYVYVLESTQSYTDS